MRKLLLVGAAAALSFTACEPDVGSELGGSPDANVVVAQFDPTGSPAVVPTPNDLAIDPATRLVKAPIDPNATPAMQEFTRDYLNTLNGFPTATPATAKIVDLDPSSAVLGKGVRFFDLLAGTVIATPSVTPTVSYNAETDTLTLLPPATGWPKGGRYLVALVGGAEGLKGVNGQPVVGSATWAFARTPEPLVTCEDLTAPDCQTATELIPSTKTDPTERLRDQTASALRLEQLRRAYMPLLNGLEQRDIKREDVALMWTFTIVDQPEVTFSLDPTSPIIPFPNDLLRTGPFSLNLPVPPPLAGLRNLDGFSTTAPAVSENSDTLGVLETGSLLDFNTLAEGAKFLKLGDPTKGTQPNVKVCINGCQAGAEQAAPQQLQFIPQVPLDERTQYAPLLTTDLLDVRGRRVMPSALFALVRSSNPLLDANGKSTVSVISDEQAKALEPVRLGFKPMFDALATVAKIPRSKIALGWAFTTQSTVSLLKELQAFPAAANLPTTTGYLIDISSVALASPSIPKDNLLKVFEGQFTVSSPEPLKEGRMQAPPVTKPRRIPFILAIPNGTMPQGGWPVTVFGHGLTGSRSNVLGIANTLATPGYARATIAIDAAFHGERSNCATISATSPVIGGDGTVIATEPNQACAAGNQVCDTDANSDSYGRCILADRNVAVSCDPATNGDVFCRANGLGLCRTTDNKCEGGGFAMNASGSPTISGWNFINLGNLFATRDNFRQFVVDQTQLHRVLNNADFNTKLTGANGAGGNLALNAAQVDYVGQSLGGLLGTLYTAVAPEVRRSVLNAAGGGLPDVLLTSPAFATRKAAFLQAAGLTEGTPQFNTFVGLIRMVLDPADPWNYAYALEQGQAAEREAFIQYIQGDQIIPNATSDKLVSAANRSTAAGARTVASYMFTPPEAMPLAKRHGFLLDPSGNAGVTTAAQQQVFNFLVTGNVQ